MKETINPIDVNSIFNPFEGPEIERVIYTTPSQAEIWIACKFGDADANKAYNESASLVLKGTLNKKAILNAIQNVVKRHEALRAVFSTDGRFMTVFKTITIEVDYQDLSKFNEIEKNNVLSDYLTTDANHDFDLLKGPLLKMGLLKLSDLEHHLIITAHHIICDGWSTGIILEELGSFYSAEVQGTTLNIAQSENFSLYAEEQTQFLESIAFKNTQNYWLKQYEDSVPTVSLPTDFPRPNLRTFKGHRLDFAIDNTLVSSLKKVGIQSGASFVVTLMAAFEVFLYQITGQDDLVLGLPASGQSQSGKTQLIGHCVNLLPLRSKLAKNIPFNDYLKQRKAAIFDAYDYQQFSFGQLLQKLAVARDSSRVPLVPIMFNIDTGKTSLVSFSGLDFKLKNNPRNYETFELFLNATGSESELILEWSYNSGLFKPETITQMMASFKEVIESVVANPSIKLGEIIKADTTAYIALNDTSVLYPQSTLVQLLENQAQITPTKSAIKFGVSEINYQNLQVKVNQLAHYLVAQGVGNGCFVAVALPRSIELVITLMAIMKTGAAYLPLDPNYPNKRLEFMLEDSEAKFLITSKELQVSFETNCNVLQSDSIFLNASKCASTPPNISVNVNDTAYIMYTSGSTGNPKGVLVTHKNLVNFLCSMMYKPGICETDRLLSITTISFDIAGLELFLPLLKGAMLVIANDETAKDSRLMLELLNKENITMLQATPSTWQMLLDAGWEERLPIKALCGGEALSVVLAKKILNRVSELWNVYGPTETTIWSAIKKINIDDDIITIGKPIANTQLYLLNEHNELANPNALGEICIAGDGVAKGYWKREDLTTEKFIPNPFETELNTTLYRTGDVGKLLPNGEVQCLGRIDHQVKIRGHRIELGEIEQVIDKLQGVDASAVIVHNDLLIANIISTKLNIIDETIKSNWKKSISETLPAHMVPHQFNLLTSFPKTLNGKIDRNALINLNATNNEKQLLNIPSTNTERIVASVWQECLQLDKIDVHSDFFELGGHSLIAVKVMTLIEKQTDVKLPLASLLEHSSISKLSAFIDKNQIKWDSLVALKATGTKKPLFVVHGANYNILIFKNLAETLDVNQPVYALQAKGLSGDIEPHDSVEAMAAHYISEIRTIDPEGPYNIGGFSFGGIIAFEMAKQLKVQGKKVKVLALFDSYAYPHYQYSNPIIKRTISILYEMSHLVFIGLNMFSNTKNFNRRINLLKVKISGWYLRLRYGSEKQQQLQYERSSKIDEKHKLAYNKYNLVPEDIQVDLFRSSENIYFAHDYNNLGWGKIALGGINKHMITGNHSEMFFPPCVNEVSDKLQNALDKSE